MPNRSPGGQVPESKSGHDSALPEALFEGWLLLLVAREPRHGYAIAKAMQDLPCSMPHQTTIYRHLSSLEERGFLDSRWQMRPSAPPIRTYHLTERGQGHLRRRYSAVARMQRLCRTFLSEASQHI